MGERKEESDGSSDVERVEEIDGQVNELIDTDCLTLQCFHSKKQIYKSYEMYRLKR